MADIFISYKSERRKAAEFLSDIFNANGYTVWYDYALISGRGFSKQIENEIRSARVVIILWCSMSVNSDWVNSEAHLAKKTRKECTCLVGARGFAIGIFARSYYRYFSVGWKPPMRIS